MKNVLVLGSGFVAKPLVEYLLNLKNIQLTVASNQIKEAEKLFGHHQKNVCQLDVNDESRLAQLIKNAHVVTSLVPYDYHPKIAKICLQQKAHLVTTSYTSNEMRALDKNAKEKGLLFLNEMGLDPGIDHMSAKRMIQEIKENGGHIKSFESCCGGFPAPEANTNPFNFKFSWSPMAVVRAGRNPAQFLKNGETIQVPADKAFTHYWQKSVGPLGNLEVYPNRDSLMYLPIYGLKNVETFFRGTFRYPGWTETMYHLGKLGYLNDQPDETLSNYTFADITSKLIGPQSIMSVKEHVSQFLGLDIGSSVIKRFEWLGLFSKENPQTGSSSLLSSLAWQMLNKMSYKKGERDMIVLQHEIVAKYANGKTECAHSLLINYGIPDGSSAMARSVGLPAAIAVKLVAEEKLQLSGVHIPVLPEIYGPVLRELETLGFVFNEHTTIVADN